MANALIFFSINNLHLSFIRKSIRKRQFQFIHVFQVSMSGMVSVTKVVPSDHVHWELFLGGINQDDQIFQVEVFWKHVTGEVAVRWSVSQSISGVVVTNGTRVKIPVSPLTLITVQVKI